MRPCDAPVQAVLPKSGWIFYTFFKVHRHFGVFFFSCIPTSICQCHCPRRDVAWTVYPMNGIPWRAAARCSSRDGTVTQNANPVRGGRITTMLVPREQRGVAATWRMKEKRRAPTSYNPLHHFWSLQGGSTVARAAAKFQQKSKYIIHLLIKKYSMWVNYYYSLDLISFILNIWLIVIICCYENVDTLWYFLDFFLLFLVLSSDNWSFVDHFSRYSIVSKNRIDLVHGVRSRLDYLLQLDVVEFKGAWTVCDVISKGPKERHG